MTTIPCLMQYVEKVRKGIRQNNKNIEAILQVEGIDGFIVGPYDMSGSLGCPGDFQHPEMVQALEHVMEMAKKYNVPAGFHVIPPDPEALLSKMRDGFSFLAFSLDTLFLGTACRTSLAQCRAKSS